jgi:uncharacterized protein YcgL (UPF0745 family)
MSPEERERFLQNDQRFHNLPPAEQARIRQHFEEWSRLSPEQKDKLSRTSEALGKLTPEQLHSVRTQLLPQWRQLTPERRKDLRQRLGSLNGLSDAERNQKLNDQNFYQGLSPQEHDVLKQLGDLKLSPGSGAE